MTSLIVKIYIYTKLSKFNISFTFDYALDNHYITPNEFKLKFSFKTLSF